jgi:hypothetical protein
MTLMSASMGWITVRASWPGAVRGEDDGCEVMLVLGEDRAQVCGVVDEDPSRSSRRTLPIQRSMIAFMRDA